MAFDVPLAITLFFIWLLLTVLGFDREKKKLYYTSKTKDSSIKFLNVDTKNVNTMSNDEKDIEVLEKPTKSGMQTSTSATVKEKTISKDVSIRQSFMVNVKNWFEKPKLTKDLQKHTAVIKKEKRYNPVTYDVKHTVVVYRTTGSFSLWERPSEKYMKRFSYKSDKDSLKYDWQNVLKRFSDRHPILYNRCLWTTTSSSVQSRQQSPVQLKGQRIILQRKIQKLTIHKTFLHKPHEKCIYTVKKDIRIESSLPSNGVKRR